MAGAFAYWSAEGLACLEQLQPVVDQRAHGPVMTAHPPELSTNKSGEISPNLIKIDNYDEIMALEDEPVTQDDQPHHSDITERHQIGPCHDMVVTLRDVVLTSKGLVDVPSENGRRYDLEKRPCVRPKLSQIGRKSLHFGAFQRHFEPPERPMLLPTPTNSHTPDPMRSVAFVASSNYVMIGVDLMASGHFFGDRGAFDVNSPVALSDAPQVEIANGAQLAPTHRSVIPL